MTLSKRSECTETLFLEEGEQPKKSPKNPEMLSPTRNLNRKPPRGGGGSFDQTDVGFSKFLVRLRKKNIALRAVFWNRA